MRKSEIESGSTIPKVQNSRGEDMPIKLSKEGIKYLLNAELEPYKDYYNE